MHTLCAEYEACTSRVQGQIQYYKVDMGPIYDCTKNHCPDSYHLLENGQKPVVHAHLGCEHTLKALIFNMMCEG